MTSRSVYRVLAYRYDGAGNVGDAIQTYALCRLLPAAVGVYRDAIHAAPAGPTAVVNGYLDDRPPADAVDCLFAGAFVERGWHYADTLGRLRRGRFPAVGARDPVTLRRLTRAGVAAEFAGCATLTLERYRGPRRGVYAVDVPGHLPKGCVPLTHRTPPGMTWAEQWARAKELLGAYRTADRVYTRRLHVALPCLAFGTPVLLERPWSWLGLGSARARLSVFDSLGLPYGAFVGLDTDHHKHRFIRFLEASLGEPVRERDPELPPAGVPAGSGRRAERCSA